MATTAATYCLGKMAEILKSNSTILMCHLVQKSDLIHGSGSRRGVPEVEDVPGADGHVGLPDEPFIKEVRTLRGNQNQKLSEGGCVDLRTFFKAGYP